MQSLLTCYVNIFKRYAAKFVSRWYLVWWAFLIGILNFLTTHFLKDFFPFNQCRWLGGWNSSKYMAFLNEQDCPIFDSLQFWKDPNSQISPLLFYLRKEIPPRLFVVTFRGNHHVIIHFPKCKVIFQKWKISMFTRISDNWTYTCIHILNRFSCLMIYSQKSVKPLFPLMIIFKSKEILPNWQVGQKIHLSRFFLGNCYFLLMVWYFFS